jgi:hypothetical protein
MNLTPEQLEKNFNQLLEVIDAIITGERKDQLKKLHLAMAERIATAPASSKSSYHNAFPGGYVLHVLNVVKACIEIFGVWKNMGSTIDFSKEELIFSAICHDLGKIGDEKNDYYLPCEEAWMLKKGQVYVTNPALQYMKVPDRSLYILQSFGIKINIKEYLTIKIHDGLYEKGNESYFISFNEDYELKTVMPYILHQADLLSSKMEKHIVSDKNNELPKVTSLQEKPKTGNKTLDKFLNE